MDQIAPNLENMSAEELAQQVSKLRKATFGCVGLFLAPFFIAGIGMLVAGLNGLEQPENDDAFVLLFIGAMFAGISSVAFSAAVLKSNSMIASLPLRKKYPRQPWMWRDDWARGIVRDKTKGAVAGSWIGAVVTTGALLFVGSRVREIVDDAIAAYPWITWPVLLLAVAIPVALLCRAVYVTLQFRKFGSSTLILSRNPCMVGQSLSGRIETSLGEIPLDGAKLKLECVKTTKTGSGKNTSTKHKTVWSADQVLEPFRWGHGPTGVYVPVEFPIPPNANPTGKLNRRTGYNWKLTVWASVPGVDYHATFEPPVFRVKADGQVDESTTDPL